MELGLETTQEKKLFGNLRRNLEVNSKKFLEKYDVKMWTELNSEYGLMAGCYEYGEELLISKYSVRSLLHYTPDWIEGGGGGGGGGVGGGDGDGCSEYLVSSNAHLLDLPYHEVIFFRYLI